MTDKTQFQLDAEAAGMTMAQWQEMQPGHECDEDMACAADEYPVGDIHFAVGGEMLTRYHDGSYAVWRITGESFFTRVKQAWRILLDRA